MHSVSLEHNNGQMGYDSNQTHQSREETTYQGKTLTVNHPEEKMIIKPEYDPVAEKTQSLKNKLMVDIAQVGDRLSTLKHNEEKGVFEKKSSYTQVVKALTVDKTPSSYISSIDKIDIGRSRVRRLDKLIMTPITPYNSTVCHEHPAEHEFVPACDVRLIDLPDRNEKHTLDLEAYFGNRLPSSVIHVAKKSGVDLFLVPFVFKHESGYLARYYQSKGFDQCDEVVSRSATHFYIVRSTETGMEKAVVANISSNAKCEHLINKFHLAGVDVNKLTSTGSIEDLQKAAVATLESQLQQLPADEKVLYIGSRWTVMDMIDDKIANLSRDDRGSRIEKLHSKSRHAGPVDYSTSLIDSNGHKILVAGLKMPYGDLSYPVVSTFIKSGFSKIFMCGSGGRIKGDADIGDYMYVNESSYKQEPITLDKNKVVFPDGLECLNVSCPSNATVNSPLVETEQWLNQKKGEQIGSVDLETAHIFRAINESDDDLLVMPGLFISDIVGEVPLNDRISDTGANKNLQAFLDKTWGVIFNH